MTIEISRLEEAWLKAESDADRVKREAMHVEGALSGGRRRESIDDEVAVLKTKAESLRAQVAVAEQAAEEAFDRLWSAKGLTGTNA